MTFYHCIKFYLIPFYIQRYAPDKLNAAKIRKGSNSVNIGSRVMVLAVCNFPYDPLSVYQVLFNYLHYFFTLDKLILATNR